MTLPDSGILTSSQAIAAVELFVVLGVVFFALAIVYLIGRIWEN